jgi:hypothetical protein
LHIRSAKAGRWPTVRPVAHGQLNPPPAAPAPSSSRRRGPQCSPHQFNAETGRSNQSPVFTPASASNRTRIASVDQRGTAEQSRYSLLVPRSLRASTPGSVSPPGSPRPATPLAMRSYECCRAKPVRHLEKLGFVVLHWFVSAVAPRRLWYPSRTHRGAAISISA